MNKSTDQLEAILNSVNDRNRFLEKNNKELKEQLEYIKREVDTMKNQLAASAASIGNIIKSNNDRVIALKTEIEYWKEKFKAK